MMNCKYLFYLIFWCTFLPTILSQINLSGECLPSIQMIDASGKLPSGILAGNIVDLGNFDECLAIKIERNETVVKGKYCIMKFMLDIKATATVPEQYEFRPEGRAMLLGDTGGRTGPHLVLGWCIPHTCPVEYLQKDIALKLLNMQVNVSLVPLYDTCQTEEDLAYNLTTGEWCAFGFYIFFVGVVVLSTIYDVVIYYSKKRPAHILLIAFSLKTNGEKLLHVAKSSDQLSCLNGIRFISMLWIVLGHRFIISAVEPAINALDLMDWMQAKINMYILNAGVAVDTFFVLSGLLLGYVFMLSQDKGVKFNIFLFYIHRYLRLTPVLAVVFLFHAQLIQYTGSGPLWPRMLPTLDKPCQENWWSSLLYIANYYNVAADKATCVGQTWYLNIDFQLFLLSPLILLPLKRWPKITMLMCTLLLIASPIICFVISYHYELAAFNLGAEHYGDKYYNPTHTRYGPWLMGLMLGYYLFKLKKDKTARPSQQFRLHPAQVIAGWVLSLAVMLACLFGPADLLAESENLDRAFFNALHRHGWALGVCWVIFACTQGYGGPINAFLSWSAFQVLGRLSYTIYLTHESLQFVMLGSLRTNVEFSNYRSWFYFCGDLLLSMALSVYLTLSFESPMLTIEKVIFGTGGRKSEKPKLPIHQTNGDPVVKSSTQKEL